MLFRKAFLVLDLHAGGEAVELDTDQAALMADLLDMGQRRQEK